VQVGALALTVPRGFYQETIPCPIRHCRLAGAQRVLVSNRPFTATSRPIYPANRVVLDLGYLSTAFLHTPPLPLDLDKLQLMPHGEGGDGTSWAGFVSGGGSDYQVHVFEGRKSPAADRATLLRVLSSIHRAR